MNNRKTCVKENCNNIADSWKSTDGTIHYFEMCQKHRKLNPKREFVLDKCELKPEVAYREDGKALCMVLDCHRAVRKIGKDKYAKICDFHGRGYHTHSTRLEKKKEDGRIRRYGVTPEKYKELMEEHEGKCAICGEPAQSVDHNHQSGKLRGILCILCNTGIGHFKESIPLLRATIAYLRRYE